MTERDAAGVGRGTGGILIVPLGLASVGEELLALHFGSTTPMGGCVGERVHALSGGRSVGAPAHRVRLRGRARSVTNSVSTSTLRLQPRRKRAAPGDGIAPRSSSPTTTYRPALDGVRAVAVGVVIAYHVGWLRGGFLGVDVFFVLSGYLITTLLLRESERTGRVNLPNFWARRARRLLPAVLLLVGACLLELRFIQSESAALGARRGDILSTLFYYANWHFIATDQSYFAAFLSVSPLRHMWSLAIEEQFYLVWPLLILVALRLTKNRSVLFTVIAAGAVASSVAMAFTYDRTDPSRSYFGTDTRANVLLAGAALAVLVHARPSLLTGRSAQRVARATLPMAAAVIVVAFAALGDQESLFYRGGSLAFAAVVAIALWALEAFPASAPARAISVRPVRWVGQISYSLYLWHWPLIIWISSFIAVSSLTQKLLAIVATFFMASVSYYVVERPIRYGRAPWLRSSTLRLAVVVPISLVLVAGITVQTTRSHTLGHSETPCPPGSPDVNGLRWCVQASPKSADAPVVVTVGDSTSRSLSPGLIDVANRSSWRYIQAGQNGCSILPLDLAKQERGCTTNVPMILATIRERFHPDVWLVSDVFVLSSLRTKDGTIIPSADPRRFSIIEDALRRTVTKLTKSGGKVVLISTPPEGAPERCGTRTTGSMCGSESYSIRSKSRMQLASIYRRVAGKMPEQVAYVSVTDIVCNRKGRCPAIVNGMLARYDGVHYTAQFSRKIVPLIVARAEQAGVVFTRKSASPSSTTFGS